MRTAVTRPVLWPREQPASPARRCVRRAGGVHENSDARYGGTRRPPDGRRRRHRPPHPEVFATSTTRQPCHQPPGRVQLGCRAMAQHSAAARRPRIGVMGGTFDPIHHGHLVAASEVADLFGLDEVVFVPTGEPWQKSGRPVSPPEDRYLMTVIATASNPRFSVSRVDIDRPGPTYTVDTLRDLRGQHPEADLFFITGADAISSILTWERWSELFTLARFVGVSRPGYELRIDEVSAQLSDWPPETVT